MCSSDLKDDLRKRLGRSPGKGDAVVMAYSEGDRALIRKALGVQRARSTMQAEAVSGRGASALRSRFAAAASQNRPSFGSRGGGEQG